MSSRHSYGEENFQPEKCRACSDFKTWAKHHTLSYNEKSKNSITGKTDVPKKVKECPLDKEELGKSTWGFLHSAAAYFPKKPTTSQQSSMKQFLTSFSEVYPCKECADDFKLEIAKSPPVTTSREELSIWMCNMHNIVNKKLGKPEFDCSKTEERWRTGWKDGSCD